MTPGLKYTLARVALFIVCTVPAVLFLPDTLDLLLRVLIGAVISALLSFVLLSNLRNEMADSLSTSLQERRAQKDRLRSALAGDEPEADAEPARSADEVDKADEAAPRAQDADAAEK